MMANEERRQAQGRKRVDNPKHPEYNKRGTYVSVLHLMVKGTTCQTMNLQFLIKRVTVAHPTDYGYYKEVYVLNDMGKSALRRKKYEKQMLKEPI